MAPPQVNRYQLLKAIRPMIADAQRIFTDGSVRKNITFLACTAIEDARGMPISLRIDIKSPTDSRLANSITIMLTNSLKDPEERARILTRERDKAVKAMGYRKNLSANRKAAGMQDFSDIPDGDMSYVPSDIVADSQAGGE